MCVESDHSQEQLYARLHNARATTNKSTIIAPVTAGTKPPAGFPATRGEFEHLTRTFCLFPDSTPVTIRCTLWSLRSHDRAAT